MISAGLQTRPANPADQQQIANLMFFEPHVHRHLDWRSPLDWLGSRHYWALEDSTGRIIAALACPQDPPGVAWLRLFTFSSHLSGPEAWAPLWDAARGEMTGNGGGVVAAIVVQPWLQFLLLNSGFVSNTSIVMLERASQPIQPLSLPKGLSIRQMQPDDLPNVVETDAAAFEPLWHNSLFSLQRAFSQASCATVAETVNGMVGYQISTGNVLGAHLARLAVRKEAQGQGIGASLLEDLFLRLEPRHVNHITVNTQSDNFTSLSLYQKMGFVRTGEQYSVFVCQL